MKSVLLIIFSLFVLGTASAQSTLPNSNVNVGLGLGMNYGGLGTKVVVGYRNSGLLLGGGYMPGGKLGYAIGAQLSIETFYLDLTYGVSGTYQVNNEPVQDVECGNIMMGFMINLDKQKTVFIDLGIGHTFGAPTIQFGPYEEKQDGITIGVGLGVRLGK